MKKMVKKILGFTRCHLNKINIFGKNIYIGKDCTIRANKGQIQLGNDIEINPHTTMLCVTPNAKIILHDNIRLQNYTVVSSARLVEIESGVNFGPFVYIGDNNHTYEDITIPIKDQDPELTKVSKDAKVLIKSGTWIGTKVTIAGNITIGKHCVIGANSVVTKDIPDYCVAAGIPAKVIKLYNFETKTWEKVKKS